MSALATLPGTISVETPMPSNLFAMPPADPHALLLQVTCDVYPPEIRCGDFVQVDVTCNRLSNDGLYAIYFSAFKHASICRFQTAGAGCWWIYDGDGAEPRRRLLTAQQVDEFAVIGRVRDVYTNRGQS